MSRRNKESPQYPVLNRPGDTSPASKKRAESTASKRQQSGVLGQTAKSVGRSRQKAGRQHWQSKRMDRLRHQRHAAMLLDWDERVGLCKYCVSSTEDGVKVRLSTYGKGKDATTRASFEGLQTCGSVWHCPMCAARVSETRRGELNQMLAWAREQGHAPFLVTLTARHGIDDLLPVLLDQIKQAKQKFHQHRAWKRLKRHIVGHVTATEVTGGGKNGWHPHYHILLIVRDAESTKGNLALLEALEGLGDPWRASLRGVGLDGGGAAYDIQDATAAGSYVAKWGAAEEMSLSTAKKGHSENRTPPQLLAASCDEQDKRAGQLWAEYARTFKGRRQLVWSRGLKAMADIGEVSDEEAAANETQDDQQDAGEAGNIDAAEWNGGVRRRRGLVLNAAEDRGAEGVADVVAAVGTEDPRPDPVEVIEPPAERTYKERMRELDAALAELEELELWQ
jgi:hypothetical protein